MSPIFMGHTRMAPMGSMQRFNAIPSWQVNVVKGIEDVSALSSQWLTTLVGKSVINCFLICFLHMTYHNKRSIFLQLQRLDFFSHHLFLNSPMCLNVFFTWSVSKPNFKKGNTFCNQNFYLFYTLKFQLISIELQTL